MTKIAALQEFYSSFGIDAYPQNNVPEKAKFPWLTYEPTMSNWYGQGTVYPAVNLYYHSGSEAEINAKADEISKKIGGGRVVRCDDGIMIVRFTSAWQPITDSNDNELKRRYTTLAIEFNTL